MLLAMQTRLRICVMQWRVKGIILEQLLLQNWWLVGGPPATKYLAT